MDEDWKPTSTPPNEDLEVTLLHQSGTETEARWKEEGHVIGPFDHHTKLTAPAGRFVTLNGEPIPTTDPPIKWKKRSTGS